MKTIFYSMISALLLALAIGCSKDVIDDPTDVSEQVLYTPGKYLTVAERNIALKNAFHANKNVRQRSARGLGDCSWILCAYYPHPNFGCDLNINVVNGTPMNVKWYVMGGSPSPPSRYSSLAGTNARVEIYGPSTSNYPLVRSEETVNDGQHTMAFGYGYPEGYYWIAVTTYTPGDPNCNETVSDMQLIY